MKTIAAVRSSILTIPSQVRSFLMKAFFLFVLWKLAYHLFLFNARVPDKQLTNLTAKFTAYLYQHILQEPMVFTREVSNGLYPKTVLYVNNYRAIGIADGCNGLELFVLYLGFIACFATNFRRQIRFGLAGICTIFLLNGFRCLGLAYLFVHHYSYADFAHHYVFKSVIYLVILALWILYSKKYLDYER